MTDLTFLTPYEKRMTPGSKTRLFVAPTGPDTDSDRGGLGKSQVGDTEETQTRGPETERTGGGRVRGPSLRSEERGLRVKEREGLDVRKAKPKQRPQKDEKTGPIVRPISKKVVNK